MQGENHHVVGHWGNMLGGLHAHINVAGAIRHHRFDVIGKFNYVESSFVRGNCDTAAFQSGM